MKRLLSLLSLVALVTLVVAPVNGRQPSQVAVITVGEYNVSKKELDRRVDQQMERIKERFGDRLSGKKAQKTMRNFRKRVRQSTVKQIINQYTLLYHADRDGVTVSESKVSDRLETVKKQSGYQRRLKESGLTEDELEKRVRQTLRIRKFVTDRLGIRVTEQQARDYYEKHKDQLGIDKSFEKIKDDLIKAIKTRRQKKEASKLAKRLRSETPIKVNDPGY